MKLIPVYNIHKYGALFTINIRSFDSFHLKENVKMNTSEKSIKIEILRTKMHHT